MTSINLLPPLNPMRTAPRDGTQIIVMRHDGVMLAVHWHHPSPSLAKMFGPVWWASNASETAVPHDEQLLGWWPLPESAE